jgi:tetratricopeptide (TPR) repeat protein
MEPTTAVIIRAEAERQAAAGNRRAALTLLDSVRGAQPDAADATLRAKILCQQGEFRRAADSWREALALDPGNEDSTRGLALAEKLARSPIGRLRLHSRHWAVSLVAIALLAAATWAMSGERPSASARELADAVKQLERQRVEDLRTATSTTEDAIRRLKEAADANHNQLRTLLADQTRAIAQAREQLRRLDKRTADLVNATRAEKKVTAPSKD